MNYIPSVITEIERWHSLFNEKYFNNELLPVIITIQKTRPNNLGYITCGKVWRSVDGEDAYYEINLSASILHNNVTDIAGVLLHEMVHEDNLMKEIKDCNGQVHNKKFKVSAERVGLEVERSKKYGFGHTKVVQGTELEEFITNEIQPNSETFQYARMIEPARPRAEKRIFKYVCPNCETKAMAKRDVELVCGACDSRMEMEE